MAPKAFAEPSAFRLRSLLSVLPAPESGAARAARVTRLVVATAASLTAAIALRAWDRDPPACLWVPAAMLGASTLLAHHGEVGSQLVARSVWWSNLVLGLLLTIAGSSKERTLGLLLAATTGAALLSMGRLGLDDDERSAFRPVAFRTSLSLGMILAVADAQVMALFGVLKITDHKWSYGPIPTEIQGFILLGSTAMILVAIAGLYRLRVWGLLLNALGALGVAALSLTGVYGLESPLPQSLALRSAVQLLLPVPLVIAAVRRRPPEPSRAPSRLARLAPAAAVVVLMGSAATVFMMR